MTGADDIPPALPDIDTQLDWVFTGSDGEKPLRYFDEADAAHAARQFYASGRLATSVAFADLAAALSTGGAVGDLLPEVFIREFWGHPDTATVLVRP